MGIRDKPHLFELSGHRDSGEEGFTSADENVQQKTRMGPVGHAENVR